MAENKLADMSTEFAIQILKLTENIKGHYSLSNQLYCSFTNKDNRTASSKWEMRSDFSFCTERWMRTHKNRQDRILPIRAPPLNRCDPKQNPILS